MTNNVGEIGVKVRVDAGSVQGELNRVSAKVTEFGRKTAQAGKAGVAPWMATSAALRLVEGGIEGNIRAAERFIAQSKTASKIFIAAFPVIGLIAVGAAIGKCVIEINKMAKASQEATQKLTSGFNKASQDVERSTDEMQLHILKTQDEISKLMGKPSVNGPAEAFVEAQIAAQDLAKSIDTVQGKMASLMKDNSISAAQSAISVLMGHGTAGTGSVEEQITAWNSYIGRIKDDYTAAMEDGNTQAANDLFKKLASARSDFKGFLTTDAYNRSQNQNQRGALSQSANIALEQGALKLENDQENNEATDRQAKSGDAQLDAARNLKAAAQSAAEAAKHAQSVAIEANLKISERYSKQVQAYREYTNTDEGDALLGEGGRAANESSISSTMQALGIGKTDKWFADSAKTSNEAAEEKKRTDVEIAAISEKTANSLADLQIKSLEDTGAISHHTAALAMASLHAQEFSDELKRVNEEQQKGLISIQDARKQQAEITSTNTIQQAQDAIAASSTSLAGELSKMITGMTNLNDAILGFINGSLNSVNSALLGGKAQGIFTGAERKKALLNGLGGQFEGLAQAGLKSSEGNLLKALGLGGKDGKQPQHVVVDNWPGGGKGGAGSPPAAGLLTPLLNKFGINLGGDGGGGAAAIPGIASGSGGGGGANPLTSAALTGAGSLGIGALAAMLYGKGKTFTGSLNDGQYGTTETPGLLSHGQQIWNSILGGFGGHYALGGDVQAGMSYDVGEMGRETFVPTTNGKIIPNKSLGGPVYNVQVNNSTSPAETEQRVRQAMQETHNQSVRSAMQVQKEDNRRSPASKRR